MYYCSRGTLIYLMKTLTCLLCLFFLLPVFFKASGNPIVINSLRSPVHLKSNLSVFEDTTRRSIAETLLQSPDLFVSTVDFSPRKRNHIFWLRTDILVSSPTEAVLSLGRISHAAYYLYAGEQLVKQGETGGLRPESEITSGDGRFHGHLYLNPNTAYTLLIQTEDIKNYPPAFDFSLHDKSEFMRQQYRTELIDMSVFGALGILLLYAALSWMATRSRSYIWLMIFIIGIALYDIALSSYLINWFFPNDPLLGWVPIPHFLHMGIIGLYLLLLDFWNIKEHSPLLYRLGIILIGCIGMLSVVNTLTNIYTSNFYLSVQLNQYFAIGHVTYISVVLVYMWRRIDRPQRFLGYGVILFLCAVLAMTLALFILGEKALVIIPFFARVVMLGVVLLFLTGLKEELRKVESDKTTYLKELTELQKHQNALLEEQVNHRTQRLRERNTHIEVLMNELSHRVKNNLQLLYSLNKLQLPTLPSGPAKSLLQDNISRIRAMILVNDNFRNTTTSQIFRLETFVTDIVKHSASIFDPQGRVSIQSRIDPDLLLEARLGLPFGLILSELVTNSYKHAFAGHTKPEISIDVQSDQDSILFCYADNGPGMDSKAAHSFGIQLIHDLTRQLKGAVSVRVSTHLTYHFTIPLT